MKILLDENIPFQLQKELNSLNFDVFSVRFMKWQSQKNGELLRLMVENEFTVLITLDKQLYQQQKAEQYNIMVLLLKPKIATVTYISSLIADINENLMDFAPGLRIIASK